MKRLSFLFLLLLAGGISSCVTPVYYPNKIHTPMFNTEEQVYVNIGGCGNSGWNGAIAYSPLNFLYVEVGGNIAPGIEPFQSDYTTKFGYGSFGLFYWANPFIIIEGEAGYGHGTSETYDKNQIFITDDTIKRSGYYVSEFDHTTAAYNRWHVQ